MQQKLVQIAGITWTLIYAGLILWIYATEPRSFNEVKTNTRVAAGIYEVNQEQFNNGLELFRRDQLRAARDVWASADPAQQDPRTQFYVAYAFYREGWGRVYYDDALFKQGLEAVDRAISQAPNGIFTVDDPNLQMHSAAELRTELEQGIERGWKDLNPLKLFRERK
jgi:hypothetical protein